jgi:hypothetical protein
MKRFILSGLAGLLSMSLCCAAASACGGPCVVRTPVFPPAVSPQIIRNDDDTDLEKLLVAKRARAANQRALQAANTARVRSDATLRRSAKPAVSAEDEAIQRRPATARPIAPNGERQESAARVSGIRGESRNDQIIKAVAVQQALAAQNARLEAKLAELKRWDSQAQEKFLRAFGTTDETVRQRVIQRIDALIERNLQTMESIADSVNFDFFLEGRKQQ